MSVEEREDGTDRITHLLSSVPDRQDELYELVYGHLKAIARNRLSAQDRANAVNTTALVNEAYLKLSRRKKEWRDRRHFFGVASEAMRRILIDAARSRSREKRGGEMKQHPLSGLFRFDTDVWENQLLDLDQALSNLEKHSAELAEVVRLRFFSGLTVGECAKLLEVSVSTIERRWRFARAWLQTEIEEKK